MDQKETCSSFSPNKKNIYDNDNVTSSTNQTPSIELEQEDAIRNPYTESTKKERIRYRHNSSSHKNRKIDRTPESSVITSSLRDFRFNDSADSYDCVNESEKIGDLKKGSSNSWISASSFFLPPMMSGLATTNDTSEYEDNDDNNNMVMDRQDGRSYGTTAGIEHDDVFSYTSSPGIHGVLEIEEEEERSTNASRSVVADILGSQSEPIRTRSGLILTHRKDQHYPIAERDYVDDSREVSESGTANSSMDHSNEFLGFVYPLHSKLDLGPIRHKLSMVRNGILTEDIQRRKRWIVWMKLCMSGCFVIFIAILGVKCIQIQHSKGNAQHSTSILSSHNDHIRRRLQSVFEEWATHHKKTYKTPEERKKRFGIWMENHNRTDKKNEQHGPCKVTQKPVFGSNHFKDLTAQEFQQRFLTGYRPPDTQFKQKATRSDVFVKEKGIQFDHLDKMKEKLQAVTKQANKERHANRRRDTGDSYSDITDEKEEELSEYVEHWKAQNGEYIMQSTTQEEDSIMANSEVESTKHEEEIPKSTNEQIIIEEEEEDLDNTEDQKMSKTYIEKWTSSDNTVNYKRHSIEKWTPSSYWKYKKDSQKQKDNTSKKYDSSTGSNRKLTAEQTQRKQSEFQPRVSKVTFASSNPFSTCGYSNWSCWLQWLFDSYPYYGGNMEPAYDSSSYPTTLDWRDVGAVTSIHSQGQCGACWAIAAVETIESALYLQSGTLLDLAEEEVILCDDSCEMCYGGWPQNAFEYAMEQGGLPLETNMSFDDSLLLAITLCKAGEADYFSEDAIEDYLGEVCPAGGESSSAARYGAIKGYGYATDRCICYTNGSGCDCDEQNEEMAIANVASYGPAVVCLDASTWQDYEGGIMTAESGCSAEFLAMNHCVQVVGYAFTDEGSSNGGGGEEDEPYNRNLKDSEDGSRDGAEDREGYWIVRNQWSNYWGMNGYAYVAMGGENTNTCGILNDMTQAFL